MGGKVKVSGAWKDVSAIYGKVGGSWKEITAGYAKKDGVWEQIYSNYSGPPYDVSNATFTFSNMAVTISGVIVKDTSSVAKLQLESTYDTVVLDVDNHNGKYSTGATAALKRRVVAYDYSGNIIQTLHSYNY